MGKNPIGMLAGISSEGPDLRVSTLVASSREGFPLRRSGIVIYDPKAAANDKTQGFQTQGSGKRTSTVI